MAMVATLSDKSSKIMKQILALLPAGEDYVKIDNSDGVYMPLIVEKNVLDLDDILHGSQMSVFKERFAVSLAHYYEQNGDLMADPEVVFLCYKGPRGWKFAPVTYRLSGIGVDRRHIYTTPNGGIVVEQANQRDLRDFCEMWFSNIAYQQELETA